MKRTNAIRLINNPENDLSAIALCTVEAGACKSTETTLLSFCLGQLTKR